MLNKHPAKWTEDESYESAFFARVTRQDLGMDSRARGCFESMPKVFKEDASTQPLRSAWIRGWTHAE